MTTTAAEQEAFALVKERYENGASENDIRYAFQRFVETAGIAIASEMSTEGPPGIGNPGRMDLYIHNTCIEFKKDIIVHGTINQGDINQLDGYIDQLVKAGSGVRNGILTDGVNYLIRHVGTAKLPIEQGEAHTVFDRAEQAPRLREYLHRVISALRSTSVPRRRTSHGSSASDRTYLGQQTPCCWTPTANIETAPPWR